MKFKNTEYVTVFNDPADGWIVRHVFRDNQNRRCTAFYPVSNESQATVLKDALNIGDNNGNT